MKLKVFPHRMTVCKISDSSQINLDEPFCFASRTDEELSLVCPSEAVPPSATDREDGWRIFRIEGVLDFSLIGILSKITGILAEKRIGVFAISTFNTDYILLKEENLQKAMLALESHGYSFSG